MDLSKITIETERLRLEPVSYQYREESFREFTPEITKFMFPKSPEKIEEVDEYLKSAQEKLRMGESFDMVILKKDTGEFLGRGGIHDINTKTPELGIWIKKSAHGHGYGLEAVAAFKEWVDANLDYEYLTYPVDKRNIASRKIPESLGGVVKREFTQTGMGGQELDEVEYHIYK
ncbi:MAG: GNAT family N-acetyltransferase [Candidatus Magasanikbacteria bacterium]|nr:GNAT family N-acetyltransferase [Candidatus Magasanikbacteria bacterium]